VQAQRGGSLQPDRFGDLSRVATNRRGWTTGVLTWLVNTASSLFPLLSRSSMIQASEEEAVEEMSCA
jgi:hypothetical protein